MKTLPSRGSVGRRLFAMSLLVALYAVLCAAPAIAASSSGTMPWDGPITTLADDVQGPVITAGVIFAIVLGCLLLAFGDFSSGGKRIVLAIVAASIGLAILRFFSALGIVGAVLR
jgi:type IV secretory pathway VirB2 component (pilin)